MHVTPRQCGALDSRQNLRRLLTGHFTDSHIRAANLSAAALITASSGRRNLECCYGQQGLGDVRSEWLRRLRSTDRAKGRPPDTRIVSRHTLVPSFAFTPVPDQHPQPPFNLPALGKIVELTELDDFVWATLHGWGALPARKQLRSFATVLSAQSNAHKEAEQLASRLRDEEEELRLLKFTESEAGKNYPYLFSLAAVRLWAMTESGVRELLVAALRHHTELPNPSALTKLRGRVYSFVGADAETQCELLADLLWKSVERQLSGVERFDTILSKIGLNGRPPGAINEVMRELAEVRHCVVHRGRMVDQRLLDACPWLGLTVGDPLPASIERFWFYRTATYWYFINLARRWAQWRSFAPVIALADQMEQVVLGELVPAWTAAKRLVPHEERAGPPHGAGIGHEGPESIM